MIYLRLKVFHQIHSAGIGIQMMITEMERFLIKGERK